MRYWYPPVTVDSAADAGMRMMGISKEKAAEYRQKLENYLRSTDSEALDPDRLKRDLGTMFDDPRQGWESLKQRFSGVNRDTLKGLLTSRGVSDKRAETVTSWVETALQKIARSGDSGRTAAPREKASLREKAEGRVRSYLVEVDDPALRYEDLRDEMELLLDDPKAGSEALIRRLKSLDRETLKSLIAARSSSNEEDAESTLRAIEDARDTVLERAEKAKVEIDRRLEAAKQQGLEAAEEARRTVSTAAWWACGAAAASGVAAALGGIVAVSTGIG